MLSTLRQRVNARDESAFTLIELLVVLIIIGVLLAIAIPSYLGFQKKAQQTAAASDVRQAIPDAEAYYADKNSYAGMDAATLQSDYDSGMQIFAAATSTTSEVPGIVTAAPLASDSTKYCISAEDGGYWAHVDGPGGQVQSDGSGGTDPCG
jgi:type IV pilus assembly protein PilA